MVLSMTGFGSATKELQTPNGMLSLSVEIKTVNTRFFEVSCRIPSGLSHLEHQLVSELKKKLVRGRVYLTIKTQGKDVSLESIVPSLAKARGYISAARQIMKHCGLSDEVKLSDIMRLPDIFSSEKELLTEEQNQLVLATVLKAADVVNQSREKEGDVLADDMSTSFAECADKMAKVEKLTYENIVEYKKQIDIALEAAEQDDDQAKIRLEELYRTFDKINVSEEIVRFQSHLDVVGEVMGSDEIVKGRRLDFICQELMREANTITSKCSHFKISSLAVDIKAEIEKAREQVQNIV